MKKVMFLVLIGVFLCVESAFATPTINFTYVGHELRKYDSNYFSSSDTSWIETSLQLGGAYDPNINYPTVSSIPTGQDYKLELMPGVWIPDFYIEKHYAPSSFSDWETDYIFKINGVSGYSVTTTVPTGSLIDIGFAEASYNAQTRKIAWDAVGGIDAYTVRLFRITSGEIDYSIKLFDSGNIAETCYYLPELGLAPGDYALAVEAKYWGSGALNRSRYLTQISQPVPEPTTMLLFGTGLLGLAGFRRKKSKK